MSDELRITISEVPAPEPASSMKKVTTWSPDTCGCVLHYEWDFFAPAVSRVHVATTVARKYSGVVDEEATYLALAEWNLGREADAIDVSARMGVSPHELELLYEAIGEEVPHGRGPKPRPVYSSWVETGELKKMPWRHCFAHAHLVRNIHTHFDFVTEENRKKNLALNLLARETCLLPSEIGFFFDRSRHLILEAPLTVEQMEQADEVLTLGGHGDVGVVFLDGKPREDVDAERSRRVADLLGVYWDWCDAREGAAPSWQHFVEAMSPVKWRQGRPLTSELAGGFAGSGGFQLATVGQPYAEGAANG